MECFESVSLFGIVNFCVLCIKKQKILQHVRSNRIRIDLENSLKLQNANYGHIIIIVHICNCFKREGCETEGN